MLQCQNVMKTYGSKVAVSNITTNIEPGKIYALLGSNGSGKTTFMKMVAGLVKPTIYKVLPIQQAEEAHAILQNGQNVGKVVLTV